MMMTVCIWIDLSWRAFWTDSVFFEHYLLYTKFALW